MRYFIVAGILWGIMVGVSVMYPKDSSDALGTCRRECREKPVTVVVYENKSHTYSCYCR